MFSAFLSANAQEYSKYAAWLVVLLVGLIAMPYVKDIVGAILLKLYEYFIQKNHWHET